MDEIYTKVRERARQIVSAYPKQAFYQDFPKAHAESMKQFESDPLINELRRFVAENTGSNLGHGLAHAEKVTLDAGALVFIEGDLAGYTESLVDRRVFLVQCAGLLHDIQRDRKNHAEEGARFAKEKLAAYSRFKAGEIEDISNAIRNHEAFKAICHIKSPGGALMSDCLYDADKFRWGPDNFSHTIWDMVAVADIPFVKFVSYYPKGVSALARIKDTFRTETGKRYGPQFIDAGMAIGQQLYEVIQTEFAGYC
jgi:hypothetical protein